MAAFVSAMSSSPTLRRLRARIGAALALAGLAASATAQAAKPDQVLWRNARGQTNTIVGKVSENSLTQVTIETGSSQRRIESPSVERVDFGDVPAAFADAQTYLGRGDLENAAAKYTLAAGDAGARPVVRARARLAAAETWLRRAGADRTALERARKECELFLSENPTNREVPGARLLHGRLLRLGGDPPKAAETFAALYREASGASPTPGYPPLVSFQAGLGAGEAYLASKEAPKAREIYLSLDGAIGAQLANLQDGNPLRTRYAAIQSEARLGEGFCLLATGSLSHAKTFFQGQLSGAETNPVRRFGAKLGLGEVLLAEGNARAAQLELAQVSAIDHTNKDRTARALVGLAECALKLQSRSDAKLWLEAVRTEHGDTPSVLRAQELLQTL
jgi:tetratricopeptide (TPR) repeat protein